MLQNGAIKRGDYTHPSLDKVMPASHFLIRFSSHSLTYVSQLTIY
ncbi:hypothetical protein VAE016_350138 [Vibrio aestuarianus]|nr:hypothetical protein VAE016_350138 [Vibrio aestuarianus]